MDVIFGKDSIGGIVRRVHANSLLVWLLFVFVTTNTMGQAQSFAYNVVRTPETAPPLETCIVDVAACRYETPLRKDMAVCFVFFNFARSKKMLMNYLFTIEKLKLASIPFYTLELLFDNQEPEIADAFHVRGTSVMFHKEALCSLLERRVPHKFKKLMFLDADIVFGKPDWYGEVSRLLGTYEVIQPFSTCVWLDSTYTKMTQSRLSVAYMNRTKTYNPTFHPGFGWAFQRKWFREVGFYQYGITGSGDTLSVAAWMGVKFPPTYLRPAFHASYNEYTQIPTPTFACATGTVYHLWHGTAKNRQYVDRHRILDGVRDVRSILEPNKQGVLELTDKTVEAKLRAYFVSREDDGV